MASDLSEVRFLTVAEVADMMRVSKMTVYRLVHSGELPAIRFGRSFRDRHAHRRQRLGGRINPPQSVAFGVRILNTERSSTLA